MQLEQSLLQCTCRHLMGVLSLIMAQHRPLVASSKIPTKLITMTLVDIGLQVRTAIGAAQPACSDCYSHALGISAAFDALHLLLSLVRNTRSSSCFS